VQPFLRGTKKPHIDYDRYLSGRSFLLFKSDVRSDKTLHIYKYGLWRFCYFLKMNTEEIVSKYTYSSNDEDGYDNANGNNINNNSNNNKGSPLQLQQKIEDYILLVRTRIENNELKAATTQTMIAPIRLLCKMNDIIINWKKINKLLPRVDKNAEDEAYTREQIKKMLEYSDLRTQIPILFMASSGMRLGGFCGLTDGCITPLYHEKTGKLLAGQVVVYKSTDDEMRIIEFHIMLNEDYRVIPFDFISV
jgi:hypothetical protein